jgi:hypothetical protein
MVEITVSGLEIGRYDKNEKADGSKIDNCI